MSAVAWTRRLRLPTRVLLPPLELKLCALPLRMQVARAPGPPRRVMGWENESETGASSDTSMCSPIDP
jgi:hypothetical protein